MQYDLKWLAVALPLLMQQARMTRWFTIALLFLGACDGAGGLDSDAGGKPIVGQGSEARAPLIVNEIVANPEGGPDWIEIFNRSDQAIDLCDYFVSDSLDRLDHYYHLADSPPPEACSPTLLDAGAYLVVYADDDQNAGALHAPFKLGDADEAHIVSTRGEAIDSLIYLLPSGSKGKSLSRQPSGDGLFWIAEPSPGAQNPEQDPL